MKPSFGLLLPLLLLLALPAAVQGQIIYQQNGPGTATVIAPSCGSGAVTIPSTTVLNGSTLSVTAIAAGAFANCTTMTTVSIPASVTSIGAGAFAGCTSLTTITVVTGGTSFRSTTGILYNYNGSTLVQYPPGKAVTTPVYQPAAIVTAIAAGAFQNCGNVTNVLIPATVTSIGASAFQGCANLAIVTISSTPPSIGVSAFANCANLTEVFFQGNAPSTVDPTAFAGDSNAIGYFQQAPTGWAAFSSETDLLMVQIMINGDTNITITGSFSPSPVPPSPPSSFAVTIPSTIYVAYDLTGLLLNEYLPVTSIGNAAFEYCFGLTSVTIGTNVTSIGNSAFANCPLGAVSIPASVTTIGDEAFADCSGLTAITVNSSNPNYSSVSGVLFNKSQTTLIQYPIGNGAASYTTMPSTVTSIGDQAFAYDTSLTSVTLGPNVASLGIGAFEYCTGLPGVTIPASVTSIGAYAFADCDNLASFPSGANVASIGFAAFLACTNLTSVTIPNSVTNLGGADGNVFFNCTGLNNVVIGNGVTSIGLSTFWDCFRLVNVTIGPNVTSIGESAFGSCAELAGVTIPNKVTSIGESAFYQCYRLASLTIPNNVTSIGDYAFYYCWELTNLTIGTRVASIGNYAFEYCESLTNVTIPASVTSIGDYAFYNIPNLTHVYVSGNAPSSMGVDVFPDPPTIYYLPGATGWAAYTATSGVPVAVWQPQTLTSDGSFGVQNNQFGFNIAWASGMSVVVEACTDLANPVWSPLQTNTLTGSTLYFSDPQSSNYPVRFYRITTP